MEDKKTRCGDCAYFVPRIKHGKTMSFGDCTIKNRYCERYDLACKKMFKEKEGDYGGKA